MTFMSIPPHWRKNTKALQQRYDEVTKKLENLCEEGDLTRERYDLILAYDAEGEPDYKRLAFKIEVAENALVEIQTQRQLRNLSRKEFERKYKGKLRTSTWKLNFLNLFAGIYTLMYYAYRMDSAIDALREEESRRFREERNEPNEKILDLSERYQDALDRRLAVNFMM